MDCRGVVPSLPGKLRTGSKQPSHVLQRQTLLEGLDQGDHQQMLGGILLPHRLLQQPGLGIVVDDGLGDGFLPRLPGPGLKTLLQHCQYLIHIEVQRRQISGMQRRGVHSRPQLFQQFLFRHLFSAPSCYAFF